MTHRVTDDSAAKYKKANFYGTVSQKTTNENMKFSNSFDINPFLANIPMLCPLKTLFGVFGGRKMRTLA